jgi:hypothetical protein
MRFPQLFVLAAVLPILTACATTSTRLAPVAPERVRAEEAHQREIVVRELGREQQRLDAVAHPIMIAGTDLCADRTAWRWGFRYDQALSWDRDWQIAARASDISDTLTVVSVVPDGPAATGGLRTGDRILAIDGQSLAANKDAVKDAGRALEQARQGDGALRVTVVRDAASHDVDIAGVQGCAFGHTVTIEGGINAYADGNTVILPWAMMRFAEDDELRVVVAHEIAHNAMGHVGAKKKNALLGGLLGVIGDLALASAGVNSGSLVTEKGLALGATAFSQDFEREADYVGMYLLARAGLPLSQAPTFWRHFAQIDPGAIAFASSHPTTAERFVRLEQIMREIEAKQAAGLPLVPERKTDK